MRRSERARKNSRLGIDARMAVIRANIEELKKEKRIYESYKKRGLNPSFCNSVIRVIIRKVAMRINQLARYERRRKRWVDGGWI